MFILLYYLQHTVYATSSLATHTEITTLWHETSKSYKVVARLQQPCQNHGFEIVSSLFQGCSQVVLTWLLKSQQGGFNLVTNRVATR